MVANKEIKTVSNPQALLTLNRLARTHRRNIPMVSDLVDIVGVLADIKPAALIDRESVPVSLITQLGLAYATTVSLNHLLYVSRSESSARRLAALHAEVFGQKLSPRKERAIGKLLGYPKTATEYFIKRWSTVGAPDELPMVCVVDTEHTASSYYQQLILSPDNWKEELAAYSEPLEATVRALTPQIHHCFERAARAEARQHRRHIRRKRLLRYFGFTAHGADNRGISELHVKR